MKKIILRSSVVLFIVLLVAAFSLIKDDSKKNQVLLQVLNQSLQEAHYEKHTIDDKLSKQIFDMFIKNLDFSRQFFLTEDIEMLSKYQFTIDEDINASTFQFFALAVKTIRARHNETAGFYELILDKPFDFTKNEDLQTDADKRGYSKSHEELKNLWYKILKYETLVKYSDLLQIQKDAIERKDTAYVVKTEAALEEQARMQIKTTYKELMTRILKKSDKDFVSEYLNAIASVYDPHSEYLPPADKARFDMQMAGKFEGIGATLQERNGYIKVVDIIPGSACWRQGELQVNDLILKVAQGANEPVSVVDMEIDNAVTLIKGKKGTEVRLTVKKIDGSIKIISIVRDVVIIEETFARSAVLTNKETSYKIGYVYLPRFYADFNDKGGRFCAKDVALEIKKLKADNVQGIILDLRSNGGGSLQDVVEMSGLFIADGPVVQVKGRYGPIEVLKDYDKDIAYNGNLVVLVNTFSASASEILAAAMQDYDRAIIIGSPSTYGKGTVQRIFDFDQFIKGNDDIKPLGVIKMTTQKFYRIDGSTTQLKGVVPDIITPDGYMLIEIGEKELDYALEYDKIQKSTYTKWTPAYDKAQVVKNSTARIAKNPDFKLLQENATYLKKLNDESIETLVYDKFKLNRDMEKQQMTKFSGVGKNQTSLNLLLTKSDKLQYDSDSLMRVRVDSWFKQLEKDIYIMEAVNVLNDMNVKK